jgi:prepilin-type N-terminal cleavage/methylation domain-containing protein
VDVDLPSRRASSDGFSVVETLVTLVILGLLAAVVLFAIWGNGNGNRGQATACAADASIITTAERAAQAATGSYLSVPGLQSAGLLPSAPRHHAVQVTGSTYTLVPDPTCTAS